MFPAGIEHYKLPNNELEKIAFIEDFIVPIWQQAYGFQYKANTIEKKRTELQELLKAEDTFLFKDEEMSTYTGFIVVKLHKSIPQLPFAVMYLIEVNVLPAAQSKGIGTLLRRTAIDYFKPDIVYEEACNPISTKSRDKSTQNLGYYNYWANMPLAPLYPQAENDIETIASLSHLCVAYFEPKALDLYDDGVKPYYTFNDGPVKKQNVISEYSQIFDKLWLFAKSKRKACMGVGISIKPNVLSTLQQNKQRNTN